MTNSTRAGAAQVDITPPLGTLINGDFITHYAVDIHDHLYAKALVIDDGKQCIAICVVDICAMSRSLLDEVKATVARDTGIPATHVLISSTHTHAAGSVESLLGGHADLPYRRKLPTLIVQAIVLAKQRMTNARIGFGSFDAPEFVCCRRYAMKPGYQAFNPVTGGTDEVKTNPFGDEDQIEGPVAAMDSQCCYLAIQNEQGEWLSVLANYSLHYVGDWPNGTISADYFGQFARALQERLEGNKHFVGIMSNGTSGEANIWDFMNPGRFPTAPFEKSRFIGEALAEKLVASMATIQWQEDGSLLSRYEDIFVHVRKPSAGELAAAASVVSATAYESIDTGDYYDTARKIYAREQVLLNDYPSVMKLPLQVIRIGGVIIGALGGEYFAETGLALKQHAKNHPYFTITMANDYLGYVCPDHEIARGGYETWRCRTSCLVETAEATVRGRMMDLIAQAF